MGFIGDSTAAKLLRQCKAAAAALTERRNSESVCGCLCADNKAVMVSGGLNGEVAVWDLDSKR